MEVKVRCIVSKKRRATIQTRRGGGGGEGFEKGGGPLQGKNFNFLEN